MSGSRHLAGLVVPLAAVVLLIGFVLAMGGGSLFGLGYTLRWSLVDSGHVERGGFTTKTSSVRTYERPAIPMVPGEELEVEVSFEGEAGSAAVSIVHAGWIRALSADTWLTRSDRLDPGARTTLRIVATEGGLHEIQAYLYDAVGTLEADWHIVNPRPAGQALRIGRLLVLLLLGLVVLVALVAVGKHLLSG